MKLWHRKTNSELRDEVEFHLAMEARKRTAAGEPPAVAQRRAEAAFGGPDRVLEECRESRPAAWLETLLRDLRHGLRGLRRSPVFTFVAVATLALGIGANTAIFSWVDAELLHDLPYAHADRLLVLDEFANGRTVSVPYPDFLDWQRQNQSSYGSFTSLAWFQQVGFNLSGAGQPEQISAANVSANFFPTLGVQPILGRDFPPAADTASAASVAILSYALWQRQFGGSPSALGKTLNLNERAYTVGGVLPASFKDYNQTDLFVPAGLFLKDLADRGDHSDSDVIARLASGASLLSAEAQMRAAMVTLATAYPATNTGEGAVVRPIRALFVGTDAPMLWLLLGAVGLVLLIACANVANLMMIRTAAREPEWAMRSALGASRGRLAGQLLVESLLLALLGALGGLGLAQLALAGLRPLSPNATLALSLPVLAFTALVAIAAAVLFGLGPALRAGRVRAGSGTRTTPANRRGVLVVAEVALALMLAAAAGLMLKSFVRLTSVNPGFRPQQVLTLATNLAGPRYQNDAALLAFDRPALERLQALPGVTSAGIGTNLPLTDNHSRADVTIAGLPLPVRGHFPHPDLHNISPGYLAALGLPLLRGRDFTLADTATAPKVALVNAAFARQYWPDQDPIGRQFWLGHPAPDNHELLTVAGVVGNTQQYGLDAAIRLEVYLSFLQYPPDTPQFVLRTALPPLSLIPAATAALHGVDPSAPVVGAKSMNQVVAASIANPRATLWLLSIFGALALLLAAIGIYGVIAYSTQQRANEIGVRMALGADRAAIARLIGGESLRLIAFGVAAGLIGALIAGRFMATLLFGIATSDLQVLAAVTALLVLVGLLASAVPIRRATRLAPWQALRRE